MKLICSAFLNKISTKLRDHKLQSVELQSHDQKMRSNEERQLFASGIATTGGQESHGVIEQGSFSVCMPSTRRNSIQNGVYESIKIVVFSNKLNWLLPFGPLAILVHNWAGDSAWVFLLSLLAIIPLAERLGYTTEQLAFYTGQKVGGLLNAAFGNATELIMAICALKNGEITIVQLSMLGSMLSNMLFVLGCAFFCGGLVGHRKEQHFTKATAVVESGLLLMSVMCVLLPAVLHHTHTEMQFGKSELSLSRFSSSIMLLAYTVNIIFQIQSENDVYLPLNEDKNQESCRRGENLDYDEEAPEISKSESLIWLVIVTIGISVLSDYLVDTMEEASNSWDMSMSFVSVILPPVASNASSLTSAIIFATKDKLDMAIGVAVGSSTQVSLFVIPFCVVVGWMMGQPMDLNFEPFETTVLFITSLIVAYLLQEGRSNYFKGLLLVLCYLIVAASFFVHESPSSKRKHMKPSM